MSPSNARQKLTAVMAADVVGYSRLMGEDPHATLATLTEFREVFFSHITDFNGRIVNAPGDSILAEFESVVDAVACAVDVQHDLAEHNEELPEHRRMRFRIGVNLGDVLLRDGDLYGDGVNIAARLESLADPGGICISGTVFEHVETRLPLAFESMGTQEVKNIAKPVEAYKVLGEGETPSRMPAARRKIANTWKKVALAVGVTALLTAVVLGGWWFLQARMESAALAAFKKEAVLPLPDKPSIAVLAFDNLSGDPAQEYFSDGLTEDIITKLASLSDLFVIARNSSFQYKGKAVDIRQVGRELGVRYVLEGSVQKSAEQVRITAQLIDAATGEHLFAKRYDRDMKEDFTVQDEIAYQVLADLHVKIGKGEAVPQILRSTNNFEAFDTFMRAWALIATFNKEDNIKAEELLLKAVELDPKFASAMGQLGVVHMSRIRRGWTDPEESLQLSEEWARRAIEADPSNPIGLRAMSRIYSRKGNHEEAIAWGERAVELNPSDAGAYMSLTWTYMLALQPEVAVQAVNKAIRLSPKPNPVYQMFAGRANFYSGRHEAAVEMYKKMVTGESGSNLRMWKLEGLVLNYMKLGEKDLAKATAEILIKEFPEYSISKREKAQRRAAFKNFDWLEDWVETLRQAGLPE